MLVNIQKKLNQTHCPACGKKHVLQAILSCNRDEKKCESFCHCSQCGISLHVKVPEGIDLVNNQSDELVMSCDIITSSCQLELLKVA